jgi:hypothetical protein
MLQMRSIVAVMVLATFNPGWAESLLSNGSFEQGTQDWQEQNLTFTAAAAEQARAAPLDLGLADQIRVAVFKDDIPPSGAPASPDQWADTLRRAGFGAAFLTSQELADPGLLNRHLFDVLLLPYGASFPVAAAGNFRQFLREGGKFLSAGGYAFDRLLEHTPEGWQAPPLPPPPPLDQAMWRYDLPAAELRGKGPLTFSGWLKTDHVQGPGMAYFAVYQYAADGSLPEWIDLCKVRGTQNWQPQTYTFDVHPNAATVSLHAGLYRCSGVAWFDDLRLTNAAGAVLLHSDFEQEFDPDEKGLRHWQRSNPQQCEVQSRSRHSGQRALQARLLYDLPKPERLNTRHGLPQDGLEVEPTQLGVFQPDYPLERVHFAQAAPGQCIIEPSLHLPGAFQGYAACGVIGFDQARWVPLLNTYDRYGRLRGAAAALLRHYAGPYARSTWAFFGVTNQNLFANPDGALTKALPGLIRAMADDTYFAWLIPEHACYRPGESVKLLANLCNGGRRDKTLRLSIEIYPGDPDDTTLLIMPENQSSAVPAPHPKANPVATLQTQTTLASAQDNRVTLAWESPRFAADFYYLLGRLYEGDQELDRIESGFVVWDEQVVAAGPSLNYHDNYLRFGKRPLLLFGTDDWGYVFNTTRETPLQWLRDMRQRRDLGVLIYENLQFGLPSSPEEQTRLFRKVDGVVQLAQKFGQVYFPGLLVGYNTAASDPELDQQKQYCREFAQRYARVPGLIYYFNGDLRCQLGDAVTPQWNDFLRQRYSTTENLRQAWGQLAPAQPLGEIPAVDFNDWGHAWDNVRLYDLNCFRAWLIRRWSETLIDSIRQADPTHPTTCEFYQLPHQGVDIPAGIDGLDLSNFGYFDRPGADLARFPAICKYNDQRARGKSVGPGEYGVKTHPAWGDGQDYGYHTRRTPKQAIDLFLAIAHYSLGLGASRLHNWCWKDDAHRVFPWGMVYPCDGVPKDIAFVHRNQSLLFRHFAPVYRESSVAVLTPDSHRLGGGKWQVHEGILQCIHLALATHVDNLGVLNEHNLHIPPSTRVLFYPLPFCPPDQTCEQLTHWVRQGGVLYLSGDISYDTFRHRTRTQRLTELCGVRFLSEYFPNISLNPTNAADQPCIRVAPAAACLLRQTEQGSPLLLEHRLGQGRVIFSTDPIELHDLPARHPADLALYRSVLQAADVKPIGLEPDDPIIHVFRVPLQDGGRVYVLFNTDSNLPPRQVTLTDCQPPVSLQIDPQRPALLWFDGQNDLRAVEALHTRIGTEPVVVDETGGMLLSLDGQDIQRSGSFLLMPLQPGQIRWRHPGPAPNLTVQTGDFQGGTWRVFEETAARQDEVHWIIDVSVDQVDSLLLVCEKPQAARWRAALEQALNDPSALP